MPARRAFLDDARRLAELVAAYNRRIEVAIAEYLGSLRQANACVERLNQQVAFSRHIPAGLQLKASDLTAAEAQVRTALPLLTPLPADLIQRLEQYYKAARPSLWAALKKQPHGRLAQHLFLLHRAQPQFFGEHRQVLGIGRVFQPVLAREI